ncbi:hypothetical protein EDD22DRAFT_955423 [Suillus occidentalis]|nr:hypothetical protein EDD22DRAFT_955423 [Suillus occidentalis]
MPTIENVIPVIVITLLLTLAITTSWWSCFSYVIIPPDNKEEVVVVVEGVSDPVNVTLHFARSGTRSGAPGLVTLLLGRFCLLMTASRFTPNATVMQHPAPPYPPAPPPLSAIIPPQTPQNPFSVATPVPRTNLFYGY